jgi:SAM-dependent methyltransferase
MKESDIRPEALLKRYLELSEQDAKLCFAKTPRRDIPCVACESEDLVREFEKNGFAYSSCQNCGTLFQSPRPSIEAFEAFYQNSVSSRYWAEKFFPAVAEARRDKIFRPRVDRLRDLCSAKAIVVKQLIDVGAGYGIFLDEWRKVNRVTQLLAVEPSASLATECRNKGFEVVEEIAENVSGYNNYADLVVCFEVLEHVYDPLTFVQTLTGMVKPGGYVFVSTLCVDGFDIQTLWDKSNSIFPPHHINFLSVAGFERLFVRAGLVDIDVSTPGQLDVDIVRNAIKRESDLLNGQRFLKRIATDNDMAVNFQKFLVANRLSSHAWVIGKKQIVEG